MKKYYLGSWLIFSAACTGTGKDSPAGKDSVLPVVDSIPKSLIPTGITGCYLMVIEKDTAHLRLDQQDSIITGPLEYKRFQKDSNTGKLNLKIKNQRLEGWYTFTSEGKLSVRQFVFKYEKGNLEEGYGDVIMKQDTVIFKYPSALRFEDKNPFKKVACP